jgi:hypothetical protein
VARDLAANKTTQQKVQNVVTRKGVVFEVVGIDGSISKVDLTNWVNGNQVAITSVRDPDGKYPQSQMALQTREYWYVVDLRTMKILARYFGSYGGGMPSLTAMNAALDDINARL